MKLFTLGPVEMFDETMEIGGRQVPYFRNAAFSEVVLRSMNRLRTALDAEPEAEIVYLTSSGTGAMEATIQNCFTPEDRLLVIDGGSFGHRFVRLCEIHGIPHDAVRFQMGETLTRAMIEEVAKDTSYTALLVNIDESSTAQLYDKQMLSDFCKERGMLFVVDAISSFLADEYSMVKYGIDATILSTQKGLSLAPGMAFVALSKRMLERVERIESGSMYFDFKDHIKNGKRGQTPFTPAVRVVYELDKMMEMVEARGVDAIVYDTHEIAMDFRKKLKEIGLSYPDYPLSNAVTPVLFPDGNAQEVYHALEERYGFVVNPSGGELADKMFRVAHIGNHTLEDNDLVIEAMAMIMQR